MRSKYFWCRYQYQYASDLSDICIILKLLSSAFEWYKNHEIRYILISIPTLKICSSFNGIFIRWRAGWPRHLDICCCMMLRFQSVALRGITFHSFNFTLKPALSQVFLLRIRYQHFQLVPNLIVCGYK